MTPETASPPPGTSRSLWLLTVAMLIALAILIAMGSWQLRRHAEKTAMLDGIAAAAKLPPRAEQDSVEMFRRVKIGGTFLPDTTVFVPDTLPDGAFSPSGGANGQLGVHVLAVMRFDSGETFLVDRGFVPTGVKGEPPAIATAPGFTSLIGFWRPVEGRHWFAIPDRPEKRVFAVRDPAVIGKALGLDLATYGFFEVERQPSEAREGILPRGTTAEEIVSRVPNNHLSYALTWFGLAATLLGVYVAVLLHARRARLPETPAGE